MLQIIAVAAGAAVAGVLGIAASKPKTFHRSRSATIDAPPEAIHALIDDFHRWTEWSPWEKMEPEMTRRYEGPASGPGAIYTWEGKKVGSGRMEMRESSPRRVEIQLDFYKPFEAHNTAEFTLEPRGGSTHVTWAMHGPDPFITRLICVFINLDKMIGKDFEAGLANLKAIAERQAAPAVQ